MVPAHSFKFAATLQAAQSGQSSSTNDRQANKSNGKTAGNSAAAPPVLIRIETKAGHGAGMALSKEIEETTDELSFLVKALDVQSD